MQDVQGFPARDVRIPAAKSPPAIPELLPAEGVTIVLVRSSQEWGRAARRSIVRVGALVCLLLLFVSSYDATHIHAWTVSPPSTPVAPHHCLLCLAAHLPLTIHASPASPAAPAGRTTALVPDEPGSYDSAGPFLFHTRPPPQA